MVKFLAAMLMFLPFGMSAQESGTDSYMLVLDTSYQAYFGSSTTKRMLKWQQTETADTVTIECSFSLYSVLSTSVKVFGNVSSTTAFDLYRAYLGSTVDTSMNQVAAASWLLSLKLDEVLTFLPGVNVYMFVDVPFDGIPKVVLVKATPEVEKVLDTTVLAYIYFGYMEKTLKPVRDTVLGGSFLISNNTLSYVSAQGKTSVLFVNDQITGNSDKLRHPNISLVAYNKHMILLNAGSVEGPRWFAIDRENDRLVSVESDALYGGYLELEDFRLLRYNSFGEADVVYLTDIEHQINRGVKYGK